MNTINLVVFTVYMLNFIPPRLYKGLSCELDPEIMENQTWMQFSVTPVSVREAYHTNRTVSYVLYGIIALKYLVAPIYFSFYSTKMIYKLIQISPRDFAFHSS